MAFSELQLLSLVAHHPGIRCATVPDGRNCTAEPAHTDAGMVRILQEEWRATADHHIDTGEKVVVKDVQGTRLIVEHLENN